MAVSNLPAFAQAPQAKTVVATIALAAGSLTTGTPTNAVPLMTAGANGAYITKITVIPGGTVTASTLYLFESSSPTSLATMYPVDSENMPAYTANASTAPAETTFGNITPETPKRLGPGMNLSVGTMVGQAVFFHVEWQDM